MASDTSILNRIGTLERQQRRDAGYEQLQVTYEFAVRPACPPTKELIVRPGVASSESTAYIDQQTVDFTDAEAMGETYSWVTAYAYLPMILCYDTYWIMYHGNPAYAAFWSQQYNNVVCEEAQTAGEAEACIDSLMNGSEAWYHYRFPLWGVVLKNAGFVGTDGNYQPIDAVNRGRSYLYRDCRARTQLYD